MPEKVVKDWNTPFVFPQKPEKLTWKQFIYNEKTGKIFGRTRYSWGKHDGLMCIAQVTYFKCVSGTKWLK